MKVVELFFFVSAAYDYADGGNSYAEGDYGEG
jgi:hypothetical protein